MIKSLKAGLLFGAVALLVGAGCSADLTSIGNEDTKSASDRALYLLVPAAPTFNPAGSPYLVNYLNPGTRIRVQSATPNSQIFYTVNGSNPTIGAYGTYAGGIGAGYADVPVDNVVPNIYTHGTGHIKAAAYLSGYGLGPVSTSNLYALRPVLAQ